MKRTIVFLVLVHLTLLVFPQQAVLIDHACTYLYKIPIHQTDSARKKLTVAYGHTSHGSQLVAGMIGLEEQYGSLFAFSEDGIGGSLEFHNYFIPDFDLGHPNFSDWADSTRSYLLKPENAGINVVMWAWCGQLSWASDDEVEIYLSLMQQLETEFPLVKFVYMTGHLDGTGAEGNLNLRNEQIRAFCRTHGKILYDFADIESFDPDSLVNYMEMAGTDNCDYDSDQDGQNDKNWAVDWSAAHPDSVFYSGSCEHSQSLNCQRKGIAAWWLFARLAGWGTEIIEPFVPVVSVTVFAEGQVTSLTLPDSTLQLYAVVQPENATHDSLVWTVSNGTGTARVDASGLLTATAAGTVTAVAAATDGSGVTGSLGIVIKEEELPTVVAPEVAPPLSVVFNGNQLLVAVNSHNQPHLTLTDLAGRVIYAARADSPTHIIDTKSLTRGLYLLRLTEGRKESVCKIAIP